MAFSKDGSSRESIQAIQFELWPDCQSGCPFCYLNGTKRVTTLAEKKANVLDAISTLNNLDIMKDYNAIGLIGGEFFQGQLHNVEVEWGNLIDILYAKLKNKEVKEVWIASSLIKLIQGDILGTFGRFSDLELDEDQRITLCTSFDTIGRFRYHFEFDEATEQDIQEAMEELGCSTVEELKRALLYNQEEVDIWVNNIKFVQANCPNTTVHVQVILTQDVIEKLIENPNYFDFITDLGCIIDFRYPSITRADCPTATVIEDYRSLLLAKYRDFPPKFFIENRNSFLKFLPIFLEKYGIEKVKNLLHQPEMRSRRLKIYVDNAELEDRWNDERDRFLPCGHLIDGLCYLDSEKCIYCDIEKFLETQESEA